MRIASPIAASAAATVKIKSEKICPWIVSVKAEVKTKDKDAEKSISSNEIITNIIFFWLEARPAMPIKKSWVVKITQLSGFRKNPAIF